MTSPLGSRFSYLRVGELGGRGLAAESTATFRVEDAAATLPPRHPPAPDSIGRDERVGIGEENWVKGQRGLAGNDSYRDRDFVRSGRRTEDRLLA